MCGIWAEKLVHGAPSSIVQAHSPVFPNTCIYGLRLNLSIVLHPLSRMVPHPPILLFSDQMFLDCGGSLPISCSLAASLVLFLSLIWRWSCLAGYINNPTIVWYKVSFPTVQHYRWTNQFRKSILSLYREIDIPEKARLDTLCRQCHQANWQSSFSSFPVILRHGQHWWPTVFSRFIDVKDTTYLYAHNRIYFAHTHTQTHTHTSHTQPTTTTVYYLSKSEPETVKKHVQLTFWLCSWPESTLRLKRQSGYLVIFRICSQLCDGMWQGGDGKKLTLTLDSFRTWLTRHKREYHIWSCDIKIVSTRQENRTYSPVNQEKIKYFLVTFISFRQEDA